MVAFYSQSTHLANDIRLHGTSATSALGPYHAYGEHFCWGRRHLLFSFYCSQMFSMSGERELENSIYHIPRREMFVFCSLFFMQTEKKAVSSGVSVTADANVNAKTI